MTLSLSTSFLLFLRHSSGQSCVGCHLVIPFVSVHPSFGRMARNPFDAGACDGFSCFGGVDFIHIELDVYWVRFQFVICFSLTSVGIVP